MALSLTYNFVRYSYRVKTHNCLTIQFPFNPTDGHKECGILRMRNADPMKVIAPTNQCYLYPCHWDIPGSKDFTFHISQPLEEQIESWLSSKLEVQEEGSEHCRFFSRFRRKIWGIPSMGVPQNAWFTMGNPLKVPP